MPHTLAATEGPGDARRLAAAADGAVVVAVGGDGTVNEVVDGLLLRDGALGPLAVLPSGSGDDFASACGFVDDPDALVAGMRAGAVRAVDCGHVEITTPNGTIARRFANDLGVGFEADVVRAARSLPLRGRALYVTATLRAVLRQRPFDATLACDERDAEPRRLLFASFCNSARVGGGLPFAPDARLDDGRLDLLEVAATSRLGTCALLTRLLRRRHLEDRRVRASRLADATLRSDAPLPVAMDGEFVTADARELRVRTLAGALRLCGLP